MAVTDPGASSITVAGMPFVKLIHYAASDGVLGDADTS